MAMKTLSAVLVALFFTACAPSQRVSPELRADIETCLKQVETNPRTAIRDYVGSPGPQASSQRNFESCMRAHGWRLRGEW
jgi:hypothetical protein